VVTAPIPPALAPIVPGGRFSIDFAIEVAIDKYERHLPLERQRVAMERAGLVVSTQTLFEQLWHLCGALSTTYSALPDLIHTADWLHIDETRWPLLDGKTPRLQQVWAMNSTNAAYYRILPSRGADAALELLRGFKGVVVCDAAGAYASAARREGIRLAACWVHGRRPLVQVESDYPEATEVLDWIDELFLIEREVPLEPANTMLQRRAAARAERSRPLVDKILAWAEANHTRIPTDIGVQPGARYLYGLRELLRVFLDHPYVPLSNNPAEQRCRRPVLGRKNHYGSKSKRGTLVAATLYSLIETAHMNGIHPAAYLRAIVEHNRDHPDAPLLPADFLARTRAQASA
jgi:transposase